MPDSLLTTTSINPIPTQQIQNPTTTNILNSTSSQKTLPITSTPNDHILLNNSNQLKRSKTDSSQYSFLGIDLSSLFNRASNNNNNKIEDNINLQDQSNHNVIANIDPIDINPQIQTQITNPISNPNPIPTSIPIQSSNDLHQYTPNRDFKRSGLSVPSSPSVLQTVDDLVHEFRLTPNQKKYIK